MSEDKKFVLPKILIGIPTYDAKNYCLDAFFENVFGFTYPKSNIEIFVADNSKTNKNALYIRDKFKVKTFWNPELVNTTATIQLKDIDDDGLVRFEEAVAV